MLLLRGSDKYTENSLTVNTAIQIILQAYCKYMVICDL